MCSAIATKPFGETRDGHPVTLYTLSSPSIEVDITDYGAAIVSIRCPDKYNRMDDVVSGFSDVKGYQTDDNYMGAVIGRVCGGINQGKFVLNDKEYTLHGNCGTTSSNGGREGFDKKLWSSEIKGNRSITFYYISQDGEEGYPGTLNISAKYSLCGSELKIHFTATTDKDTIVNLANNACFNLSGHGAWNNLKNHRITVYSNFYLSQGQHSIPSGDVRCVENTLFDFRKPQFLSSERLRSIPGESSTGYDHCFCLPSNPGRKLAAKVEHKTNGRIMTVETTQSGLHLYTANNFDDVLGKQGVEYGKQSCVTLRTQNWPDAINRVGTFPDPTLRAGKKYDQTTWIRFSHTV